MLSAHGALCPRRPDAWIRNDEALWKCLVTQEQISSSDTPRDNVMPPNAVPESHFDQGQAATNERVLSNLDYLLDFIIGSFHIS